jgi:hypothetical protein
VLAGPKFGSGSSRIGLRKKFEMKYGVAIFDRQAIEIIERF